MDTNYRQVTGVYAICKLLPTDAFLSRKKQEMHFRPGPRWGSLQHSPRPPSWIKGGTSKGRRWEPTSKGIGMGEGEGDRGGPLTVARPPLEKLPG